MLLIASIRSSTSTSGKEPILPLLGDARAGDVMHSCGSNQRIQAMIDWKPEIDVRKGIESLVKGEDARR